MMISSLHIILIHIDFLSSLKKRKYVKFSYLSICIKCVKKTRFDNIYKTM